MALPGTRSRVKMPSDLVLNNQHSDYYHCVQDVFHRVIGAYPGFCLQLFEGFIREIVVEFAGLALAGDHTLLEDGERRVLQGPLMEPGWSFVNANHRPTRKGGALTNKLFALVLWLIHSGDFAVRKPISKISVMPMAGRDPQRIVLSPDKFALRVLLNRPLNLFSTRAMASKPLTFPANSSLTLSQGP